MLVIRLKSTLACALLLCAAASACAASSSGDADDADDADEIDGLTPEAVGKADAPLPGGAYEKQTDERRADDIVTLDLLAPNAEGVGAWVWQRCYDTPCSKLIPQDGTYTMYRSKTGRKYIKFFTLDELLDVYAYTLRGHTIQLRRAYTSRTFGMATFSDETACDESGGTWAGGDCDCSAIGNGAWGTAPYLQPGLGGCVKIPLSGEDMCDSTQGSYTDDDNNLVGTYCECGVDRYFADGVGCTDVPR